MIVRLLWLDTRMRHPSGFKQADAGVTGYF